MASSMTTSISDIISTPSKEKCSLLEKNASGITDTTDIASLSSTAVEEQVCKQPYASQSGDGVLQTGFYPDVSAVASTVPHRMDVTLANSPFGPPCILSKPQTAFLHPLSQQHLEKTTITGSREREWAMKVQQINRWQEDVKMAMQELNRPPADTELRNGVESQLEPVARSNPQIKSFDCDRLEKLYHRFQHQFQEKQIEFLTNNNADGVASYGTEFFAYSPNQMSSPIHPSLQPSQLRIECFQKDQSRFSQKLLSNTHSRERTQICSYTQSQTCSNPQSSQKVTTTGGSITTVIHRPCISYAPVSTSPMWNSGHYRSGYAEAISLATAANDAVHEAFHSRCAPRGTGHQIFFKCESPAQVSPDQLLHIKDVKHVRPAEPRTSQTVAKGPLIGLNFGRSGRSTLRTSFIGTGRINVPPRHIQPTVRASVILSPLEGQASYLNDETAHPRTVNISTTKLPSAHTKYTPTGIQDQSFKEMRRSQSVGPAFLPPPIEASAYPHVTDISKGLQKLNAVHTPNGDRISSPIHVLPPQKFILGHVASNEDICIDTETPFAFNIAATGKQICISKVPSAGDIRGAPLLTYSSSDRIDQSRHVEKGIPVSLRLTFGSTPCVNSGHSHLAEKNSPPVKTYRSTLHINISDRCGLTDRNPLGHVLSSVKQFCAGGHFLNSLPSLSKPPLSSPQRTQTAELTFFD